MTGVRPRPARVLLRSLAVGALLAIAAAAGPPGVAAAGTTPAPGQSTGPSTAPSGPVTPPAPPGPPPAPPAGVLAGNDISWTQCSVEQGGYANPMPDDAARFVVLGLSQGRAFTANPCLAEQAALARTRHLLVSAYVFPTYPSNADYKLYGAKGPYSTRTVEGRLMNVGWHQAKYWVAVAARAGVRTPMIWVDVEQRNREPRWTARPADRNLPVIKGVLAGLKHSGFRTGIYTTSAHWKEITGGVRLGQPEWRTVGRFGPAEALATCGKPGNQGSPVLLAQYFTSTVDYDVACPALTAALLPRYFHRY